MNPSENEFVTGMFIFCAILFVIMGVSKHLFYFTLSEEDAKFLELEDKPLDYEMRTRSIVLALVNVLSTVAFFLNSAILCAVLLKEHL